MLGGGSTSDDRPVGDRGTAQAPMLSQMPVSGCVAIFAEGARMLDQETIDRFSLSPSGHMPYLLPRRRELVASP